MNRRQLLENYRENLCMLVADCCDDRDFEAAQRALTAVVSIEDLLEELYTSGIEEEPIKSRLLTEPFEVPPTHLERFTGPGPPGGVIPR